jgi:AcrR family transcriptional regulator
MTVTNQSDATPPAEAGNQSDTIPKTEAAGPSRRSSLQVRSTRATQRILDAASTLFEHTPPQEVTLTQIASAAGVSASGLYRFFPDKQSIIDALAVRHVQHFRASLVSVVLKIVSGQLAKLKKSDPADMLSAIIDAYVLYLDAHPDFRAISFGRHISGATRERQVAPDSGITGLLKRFMLEQMGAADTAELDLRLRLVSEAGEHLIAYAYEQPAREDRDRILAEMKTMLAGYLFAG